MLVMKHLLINFESNIKNSCFLKKIVKLLFLLPYSVLSGPRTAGGFLSLDTNGGAVNTVIFFIL